MRWNVSWLDGQRVLPPPPIAYYYEALQSFSRFFPSFFKYKRPRLSLLRPPSTRIAAFTALNQSPSWPPRKKARKAMAGITTWSSMAHRPDTKGGFFSRFLHRSAEHPLHCPFSYLFSFAGPASVGSDGASRSS